MTQWSRIKNSKQQNWDRVCKITNDTGQNSKTTLNKISAASITGLVTNTKHSCITLEIMKGLNNILIRRDKNIPNVLFETNFQR